MAQSSTVATDGAGNVFMARAAGGTSKLDGSGDIRWSKPYGALVATDPQGNVVVAGTFAGTLQLEREALVSSGGTDAYLVKLDSDGNELYGIALGRTGDESAESLAVDGEGSAVVSGPGLGTIKLDAAGRTVWQKDFHGAVAVDSLNSVVLTGALTGTASFGSEPLASAGGEDIFVAKLDRAGHHVFSHRFGDSGVLQHGEAIAVDAWDNILVSGVLDGTVNFGGEDSSAFAPAPVRPRAGAGARVSW